MDQVIYIANPNSPRVYVRGNDGFYYPAILARQVIITPPTSWTAPAPIKAGEIDVPELNAQIVAAAALQKAKAQTSKVTAHAARVTTESAQKARAAFRAAAWATTKKITKIAAGAAAILGATYVSLQLTPAAAAAALFGKYLPYATALMVGAIQSAPTQIAAFIKAGSELLTNKKDQFVERTVQNLTRAAAPALTA